MKFFSKRSNAFIIAVVVVVLVTVFGVRRSAGAEAQKVIDEFSSGDASIQSQLGVRTASSLNMYSIYTNYRDTDNDLDSAAETLRSTRSDLAWLMESGTDNGSLFKANEALQSAGEDYYAMLSSLGSITSEDSDYLQNDYGRFNNAQRAIGSSTYNSSVLEFNRAVLSSFPLTLFRSPGIPGIAIEIPELFA